MVTEAAPSHVSVAPPSPSTEGGRRHGKVPHSDLEFKGYTLENLNGFPERLRKFEKEHSVVWDRDFISKEHVYMLKSIWNRWPGRVDGETYKTCSSENFIKFLGYALSHIFPTVSANSNQIDRITRLCSVIKSKVSRIELMKFVIELKFMGCQLEKFEFTDVK